ncbi:MAG TPA: YihY/virulence factor BrkB family protein [Candidatus Saccharimonadales bacterium]|nr:YihY/virulence factor BrkB family protein [Candidatus Saccharimonadales bacterium]
MIPANGRFIILNRLVNSADRFQQCHKFLAFPYAVIKKYGEDNGGYQAALLTYYGFLSLFPLLLVATSVLQIILHSHPNIRSDVIGHATQYFPVLGEQLQSNVHTAHGAGVALVIGLLLTLWGAKGVADVFQYSLNHIWHVPRIKRPGFPSGLLKSLAVIILGGIGLVAASLLSGLAAGIDHTWAFRIIASLVSILVLYLVFWTIFRIGLAGAAQASHGALFRTALTAAIGVQILQIFGGYLVTHELGKLKHLYGTFAATLGLLFWIYLEARLVMYAAVVGAVYDERLWPRSLDKANLTAADRQALKGQAKRERSVIPEKISVGFKDQK